MDKDSRRRAQAGHLRADISAVRRAVLTLADRGMADAPEAADGPAVALRARQLATGCAAQPDPDMLGMVLSQMRVVQADAETALKAANPRAFLWKLTPRGRLLNPT